MGSPVVTVLGLGGTIASTPDGANGGVVPSLDAAQLVAGIGPDTRAGTLEVRTRQLRQVASSEVTIADMLSAHDVVLQELQTGADGVVIAMGTVMVTTRNDEVPAPDPPSTTAAPSPSASPSTTSETGTPGDAAIASAEARLPRVPSRLRRYHDRRRR